MGTSNSYRIENKRQSLSRREVEVGCLRCKGLSHKQICDYLEIAPKTLQAHISSIYRKTGAHNTATLYRFFLENGLLQN
jgi:DNA-binding NarL/FixJ family response regulator